MARQGRVWDQASVSIRRAVLMGEFPLRVRSEYSLDVVRGIADLVASAAVADLEIDHVAIGAVDEMMRGPAGRKAGAHAGGQCRLAAIGHQSRLAFENKDELVLPRMAMQQG